MIKAIIFDNGGVIEKDARKQFYNSLSKRLGISLKEQSRIIPPLFHQLDRGFITTKEFWKKAFFRIGRKFDKSATLLLYTIFKRYCRINKPVLALAKKLRSRYIVAMLSNTIEDHARLSRQKGIYRHFNPLILSHKVGMRKPNKNIYQYALKKLKLKPKECVFIDNNERNMPAPKKLGIHTILFRNYTQLKKDLKRLGVEA